MLESEIVGLRADLKAHTAALVAVADMLNGKTLKTAPATAPAVAKPAAVAKSANAAKPAATTYSAEEVTAMCVRVKNEIDAEAAKALIAEHGQATSLKLVKPENFAALYAACQNLLSAPADDDDTGEL